MDSWKSIRVGRRIACLLRRYFRCVALRCRVWPDVLIGYPGSGCTWPDVALDLRSLAPRDPVSNADVRMRRPR